MATKNEKAKLHVKTGDSVVVVTGKDNGKKGKVINVDTKKGRVYVDKLNLVSRHTKPTQGAPQGGIIKMEAPINLSNLAVVDPKSGRDPKPTRVGFRMDENGKKVRYSKKSGEEIK